MTFRQTLVGEVMGLLAPLAPQVVVEHWPDNPNWGRLAGKAAVWVGYMGARSGRPEDQAGTQTQTIRFDLAVLTRSLQGPMGAVNLLTAIEEAAVGKRIDHGGRIWWESDQFGGHRPGVWRYDVVLAVNVVRVAKDPSVDPTEPQIMGPALTYLKTENDPGGDTEKWVVDGQLVAEAPPDPEE